MVFHGKNWDDSQSHMLSFIHRICMELTNIISSAISYHCSGGQLMVVGAHAHLFSTWLTDLLLSLEHFEKKCNHGWLSLRHLLCNISSFSWQCKIIFLFLSLSLFFLLSFLPHIPWHAVLLPGRQVFHLFASEVDLV